MAEKSKMDRAFEKRDIFMIMDPEDMDKCLFGKRYYPATDVEFGGIGYFKFVMFDENTIMIDLDAAMNDATKFSKGFGIGIDVVINVEHPIYELHKDMIDTFVADYNLVDPYFIERRGKPQKKWDHGKALTGEEVQSILNSCKDERDTFMITTLYNTGMRVGEFIALRRYWIEMNGEIMIVNVPREDSGFRIKSPAGERMIYVTDKDAISIIQSWFENNKSYGRTDVTAWNRCIAIAKKAGITHRVTPHTFRHSAISKWVWEGLLAEETIRKMAGHTDIKFTSQYYIHQIKGEIPSDVLKSIKPGIPD